MSDLFHGIGYGFDHVLSGRKRRKKETTAAAAAVARGYSRKSTENLFFRV